MSSLAQPDTQDVDGTSGSDEAAFFRTTDRNKPHNAYASGEGLQKVIEKKGYSLGYRGLSDENHFRFATKAEPNTLGQYGAKAKDATYIDMSGCYPLTRCYFEFNEDDGLYYRSTSVRKHRRPSYRCRHRRAADFQKYSGTEYVSRGTGRGVSGFSVS